MVEARAAAAVAAGWQRQAGGLRLGLNFSGLSAADEAGERGQAAEEAGESGEAHSSHRSCREVHTLLGRRRGSWGAAAAVGMGGVLGSSRGWDWD